ncbi:MAG: 16S rRNA (cytidine(1402)-2'-O)-methyltransferase [Candidatus Omnitrophica bacterium]|nr:16S rRNA (cytidine(1402)-2'-O)-methyltransferase [Candidatus Omnitrophota bacterium]
MLYVVGTPIGNLSDITLRALEILKKVDSIVCEDTRETLKLLKHYGIEKPLFSFFREKEKERVTGLIRMLKAGKTLALVCDRGTPGISDPAYLLVRAAREAGIPVSPIPGPSSLTAALSVSGLPADSVAFYGFLPRKIGKKKRLFEKLKNYEETLVFFESVHRLQQTMQLLQEIFGNREVTLCRELTKKFEEIQTGQSTDIANWLQKEKVRGEFVILVRGKPKTETRNRFSNLPREKQSGGSLLTSA